MKDENTVVINKNIQNDKLSQQEIILINEDTIQSKIYLVRGQKVMLDFELAEIYGYTTTKFNQQVKNNIEKFDEDFMFELTKEEFENLMSKKLTSSWGGRRKLPKVFTEQGIYMLMTVLKGDLATRQSKALIRTFKQMKDYIIENQNLIGEREYLQLSMQVSENILTTMELRSDLNDIEDQMDKLSNVVTRSELSEVMNEFGEPHIVKIFSDNLSKGLRENTYKDFCKEYPHLNIQLYHSGGIFHDRYIIIDYHTDNEKIYLCGTSSKDAGRRITSILEDPDRMKYTAMIQELMKNEPLILK